MGSEMCIRDSTSPYTTDYPVEGVSTAAFIKNMGDLIETLEG